MKRNYFVFCLMALFGSLNMQAYDFEANGIYYTVTDTATASAQVAVAADTETRYEGTVAIPSSVTYEGKTYSVTAIDEKAFYYCKGLTGVTIPESVKKIGANAFRNCAALTTLPFLQVLPASAIPLSSVAAA